jgi:hypothetical protein
VHTCDEHQTPTYVGVFYCSLKMRVKFRPGERRPPKPNDAGSMPVTLAIGCEAHTDEQASHKRKVVSSNLAAATKLGGIAAIGM